jgi:hypothetical protein
MCGALCCFYPCRRCARDIARGYDQFRGARRRWFVFLPPLSYSLSPPCIYPNARHKLRESISNFRFLDVVRAISEAISIVSQGKHDPLQAHERMKTFYDWDQVTARTEVVYHTVMRSKQIELWERMRRWVGCPISHAFAVDDQF